jgi:hypothetical protein
MSYANLGTGIYDGAAELGTATSILNLVVGIIIGFVLICVGCLLWFNNQSNLIDTTANITSAICNQQTDANNATVNSCTLGIKYNVKGVLYQGVITTVGDNRYNVGGTVDITYDSKDPYNVTSHATRYSTIGYVLSAVGMAVIGFVYLNYYMTRRYKAYAALGGVEDVARLF